MPASAATSLRSMNVVILTVESLLYGIFLVLFVPSFRYLFNRHKLRRKKATAVLVVVAILLAFLLTAHLALDISHAAHCFVAVPDEQISACFDDLTDSRYLTSSVLYVIITGVGDAFLAYRLYVVWGRRFWIIAFPSALIVAMLANALMIIYHLSRSRTSIYNAAGPLITVAFSLVLANNLFCTPLIAYKIWASNANLSSVGLATNHRTMQIAQALIQSAALYSTCLILNLAFYLAKNNAQFVMVAVNTQIVGIVFCLIMLPGMSAASTHGTRASTQGSSSFPLRHMAIRITTEARTDLERQTTGSKNSELNSDLCAHSGHADEAATSKPPVM